MVVVENIGWFQFVQKHYVRGFAGPYAGLDCAMPAISILRDPGDVAISCLRTSKILRILLLT